MRAKNKDKPSARDKKRHVNRRSVPVASTSLFRLFLVPFFFYWFSCSTPGGSALTSAAGSDGAL